MVRVTIWGQKVKGHGGMKMLETALSGLVNTMSWKSLSWFSPNLTNDVLCDGDECIKFWGQKVKVQGRGGITYAGTTTAQAEAYSTRRLVSSWTF